MTVYDPTDADRRFDTIPDGALADIGSLVLDRPLVLTGKTGVRLSGGSIYYNGPPDQPAVVFDSCTRCSLTLTGEMAPFAGSGKGIGVAIVPRDESPIAAVQNRLCIDLLRDFATGYRIGVGNAKACDETWIHDGTIANCGDGIVIDGGNAQLQYVDRVRMGGCTNACVNVVRGGVHAANCTLSYSPVAVLVGEANPYIVLRDVYAEGGNQEMFYVATVENSNNPGTLQIHGGGSYCTSPFMGTRCAIRWLHNAPLTIMGHDLGGVLWAEEGVVYGRGVNLTEPTPAPKQWFRARGNASWDAAGSQRRGDGTWAGWAVKS